VLICVSAGYFFGQFAFVQKHFELVIVAIIVISVLPVVWEFWQAKRAAKRGGDAMLAATTIAERAGKL
jgi:membrane-associated protein